MPWDIGELFPTFEALGEIMGERGYELQPDPEEVQKWDEAGMDGFGVPL